MEKYLKNHLPTLVGVVVGAVAGFLYWQFVGCTSGSCAITSSPFNSTIYGAVMGGFLLATAQKPEDKKG